MVEINALEIMSNNLHHELQGRINALESAVKQMSAQLNLFQERINRTTMGGCRNSFFVFVSDRSRSGLAENLGQIRFS
jgi:hypothetical protein